MRTTDTIKTSGAATQLSPCIHQLGRSESALSATQTLQGKVEPIMSRQKTRGGDLAQFEVVGFVFSISLHDDL